METVNTIDKRSWEILYSRYEGPEKKALELVVKEMGALILRDSNDYIYHVLPLRMADGDLSEKNAVIIGTYQENPLVRRYIKEDDIPQNGYLVKVFDDPEKEGRKLAVITAHTPREVFYGATDFVDDYFAFAMPCRGQLYFYNELFTESLPDYCHASAPKTAIRSIFTWAHPITDYREYIENAARMRFNELILWNDYAPVNARDVVAFAHEYGIRVIWGYAWGWSRNCASVQMNMDSLNDLRKQIVAKYESEYANAEADGIYFQSFTELHEAYIEGRLIADVVTDFVNATASDLLAKHPDLELQFGLHATSVKDHLPYLAKVDPRVADAISFTDTVASLRSNGACGALYKGQLTLDWYGDHFVHQAGPYLLGVGSRELTERDRAVTRPLWRHFQNGWIKKGKYAYRMTQHVQQTHPEFTLGVVGNFSGHIPYSAALCAALLWDSSLPYDEIVRRVQRLRYVEMV